MSEDVIGAFVAMVGLIAGVLTLAYRFQRALHDDIQKLSEKIDRLSENIARHDERSAEIIRRVERLERRLDAA